MGTYTPEFMVHRHIHCIYSEKSIYADFCAALELAVEYVKVTTGNPEFSLGIDPYADVVSLTHNKSATSQSEKSHTPRSTSSQAKRFAAHSSTSAREPARNQSKSTSKTKSVSKRDRNAHIHAAAAGSSPILADSPKPSSDDAKLKSSNRKRGVDSFGTEGEEKRTSCSKPKKLKTTTDDSKEMKHDEVIPRKLTFDNDETVAGEGPTGSITEDLPQSVRESLSHSIQEGPFHCIGNGPSNSSTISKMEHKLSLCPGSLSNGDSSMLPSLDSVEKLKVESENEPVGGNGCKAGKEEEQSHLEVDKGAATGLLRSRMSSTSESDKDDVMLTESDEGFGGLSDSDDDSLPPVCCKVKEDMTCKMCVMRVLEKT